MSGTVKTGTITIRKSAQLMTASEISFWLMKHFDDFNCCTHTDKNLIPKS